MILEILIEEREECLILYNVISIRDDARRERE
jgi:hypothetical protein